MNNPLSALGYSKTLPSSVVGGCFHDLSRLSCYSCCRCSRCSGGSPALASWLCLWLDQSVLIQGRPECQNVCYTWLLIGMLGFEVCEVVGVLLVLVGLLVLCKGGVILFFCSKCLGLVGLLSFRCQILPVFSYQLRNLGKG